MACLSGEIGRRTGLKILRESNPVPVQVRPQAPFFWRNTQVWLKGLVLKTRRSGNRRGGSNPSFSAILKLFISRNGAVWQLAGLITRRSLVQIQLPQPIGPVVQRLSRLPVTQKIASSILVGTAIWFHSSVGRAQD